MPLNVLDRAADPSTDMSVGRILREARQKKGYTLAGLAKKTTINQNSIAKYERAGEDGGQYPPFDKLALLCLELGLDPRKLVAELIPEDKRPTFAPDGIDPDALAESVAARLRAEIAWRGGAGEDEPGTVDPLEHLVETLLPRLGQVVAELGINARRVPSLVEAVEHAASALELSELVDALERQGAATPEVLPDDPSELPMQEVDLWCERLAALLIVRELYPERGVDELSFSELRQIVKAINEQFTPGLFDDDAVELDGMFEGEDAARARFLLELPVWLVKAAKRRQAIHLPVPGETSGPKVRRKGNRLIRRR